MEPHPIPQNVTSFEFHLVGDMTLKQFLYLGAGLGTAYLLYATLFFSLPIIAAPLIIICIVLGVTFAFVPIYDRSFDHWVKAFFKAIYSPTKGVFKIKDNPKLKITPNDPFFKNRLQMYLSSMGLTINLWDKVAAPIPIIPPTKEMQETEKEVPAVKILPTQKELVNLVNLAKEAQILQSKISDTEKLIKQMTINTKPAENQQVSSSLKELLQQTEELYNKTSHMKQVTASIPQPLLQPKIVQTVVTTPNVTVVSPLTHKKTTVVLTLTPNVINGIVSDDNDNFLENVIVIIHDKEGLPVRALKTNKLGQFTGATPLPLGEYTVTLEKEGFSFQTLQLTLNNSVLTPLQIIAKRGEQ